jgi:hypothetical protein
VFWLMEYRVECDDGGAAQRHVVLDDGTTGMPQSFPLLLSSMLDVAVRR